jgi:hypothetical protein
MIKKVLVTLFWCALVAAPLHADLKYTTHTEMKPVTGPAPATPANPLLGMIGTQMVQQMLPGGPADTVYIIGANGMRMEFVKGGISGSPEGTVMLLMTNGDIVQLNSRNKTYWKSTAAQMGALLQSMGMQPQVTVKPGTDTVTIAGIRAKRSDFEINIALPIPEEMRAQLPPGMPTAISMSGEMWAATTPYEKYLPVLSKAAPLVGGMGMSKLIESGITMRQVTRSDLFAGQQLEMVVTSIGEEAVPASQFAVPADYTEVPSPIK